MRSRPNTSGTFPTRPVFTACNDGPSRKSSGRFGVRRTFFLQQEVCGTCMPHSPGFAGQPVRERCKTSHQASLPWRIGAHAMQNIASGVPSPAAGAQRARPSHRRKTPTPIWWRTSFVIHTDSGKTCQAAMRNVDVFIGNPKLTSLHRGACGNSARRRRRRRFFRSSARPPLRSGTDGLMGARRRSPHTFLTIGSGKDADGEIGAVWTPFFDAGIIEAGSIVSDSLGIKTYCVVSRWLH